MSTGRNKSCPNLACIANMRQVPIVFPADKTRCPLCGEPLEFITRTRVAGRGTAKSGGKLVGYKIGVHRSSNPILGRKLRKKKQPKKWTLQKDGPSKNVGRKQ